MKTFQDFVSEHGITLTAKLTDRNPITDFEGDHWRVTLRRPIPQRQMTLTFSKGYGHRGAEPTAAEVLECLASDASGADQSFKDWAGDYGYDIDSRKAERIYKAVAAQTRKLGRFLGASALTELLDDVEA